MSQVHTIQAADGVIVRDPNNGIMYAKGTTVPSDGGTGYSAGCIFVDTNASAGSQVYINEGSATSCDFNALISGATSQTVSAARTFTSTASFSDAVTFSGQVDHAGTVIGAECISPTAALTLTSAHYGKTILATSKCRKCTLPLAAAGLDGVTFTFVNAYAASAAATELWIDPVSGDKVNLGTTGIGLRLQATADAVGDALTLVCDGSNWYSTAKIGTWAAASAA